MNAHTTTSELNSGAGIFAPAAETSRAQDSGMILQTALSAAAGPKARLAKWLLLPAGVCAAIVLVKAAVLAGEIFVIVNTVYDSSLT
jgi:hypothetical protein